MLTSDSFPVDKALILLGEIQSKIYENFPKIQKEDEEENLAGAKIYISDICSKYSLNAEEPSPAQQKMQEAQQKIRDEGIQLQLQIDSAAAQPAALPAQKTTTTSQDSSASEGLTLRQKMCLGVFFFACALYIIIPIIDSST